MIQTKDNITIGIQVEELCTTTHNYEVKVDLENNEVLVFNEISKIKEVRSDNIEAINTQKDKSSRIEQSKLGGGKASNINLQRTLQLMEQANEHSRVEEVRKKSL